MTTDTHTPTKADLHQFTPGALLPLLVAIVTGVLTFIALYVIAWTFGSLDPHKWATVPSVLSMLYMWTSRMNLWSTLAQWERWTGIDLNNDGKIGETVVKDEQPKTSTIWIDLRKIGKNGGYGNSKFQLPKGLTDEHLTQIARDLFVMGKTFTEEKLSGPGKISLPKFRQLRAVMKTQGLCEKIGTADNADFELTDEGEAWLRTYLPSPAPSEEDA